MAKQPERGVSGELSWDVKKVPAGSAMFGAAKRNPMQRVPPVNPKQDASGANPTFGTSDTSGGSGWVGAAPAAPAASRRRTAATTRRSSSRSRGRTRERRAARARCAPLLGAKTVTVVTWQDADGLVTALTDKGLRSPTIKKTILILAMVLDYAEVDPNPAQHRNVKLPTIEEAEPDPPIASQIEAVFHVISAKYRLPLLVYDDTGMRLSELEKLTWGDVDVYGGRWRITRATSKTVDVPDEEVELGDDRREPVEELRVVQLRGAMSTGL